ncbi:hypothetical protein ACLMJK_006352 [Lecanora helva]
MKRPRSDKRPSTCSTSAGEQTSETPIYPLIPSGTRQVSLIEEEEPLKTFKDNGARLNFRTAVYHMDAVAENSSLKQEKAHDNVRDPTYEILEWDLMKRKPLVPGWNEEILKHDRCQSRKKSAIWAIPSITSGGLTRGEKRQE